MIRVDLHFWEYRLAACAGFQKSLDIVARGNRGDKGSEHPMWTSNIDGEIATYAVARTFGFPWEPVDRSDRIEGDVRDARGNRYEVRSTRRLDGNLLLHPNDPDDHWAILVRGGPLTLWIVGAILVAEGKQRQYWRDFDRPCFVVPAEKLTPLLGREVA